MVSIHEGSRSRGECKVTLLLETNGSSCSVFGVKNAFRQAGTDQRELLVLTRFQNDPNRKLSLSFKDQAGYIGAQRVLEAFRNLHGLQLEAFPDQLTIEVHFNISVTVEVRR